MYQFELRTFHTLIIFVIKLTSIKKRSLSNFNLYNHIMFKMLL